MEIRAKRIKETAKAELLEVCVSFNDKMSLRQLWMPKSVINWLNDEVIEIADWFASKTSKANAYNGYLMNFEY